MQSMLSANEMELQQHELNWSSQLSPGVLGRKDGTSYSLLQIWRSRWYVVHGVSPTALVYQSSAFPAQVVFPESAGLTRAARARAAASVDGRGIQSM